MWYIYKIDNKAIKSREQRKKEHRKREDKHRKEKKKKVKTKYLQVLLYKFKSTKETKETND
jgi:hypothetical protein